MQVRGHCLIKNWQDSDIWSTVNVPTGQQFEHWCDFVNQAHLTWNIGRRKLDHFPAYIREGRFGDVRLVNLTSAEKNIRGDRGAKEIALDDVALYNVLYIAEGTECLVFNEKDVVLNPGEFMLWDSTRPMSFITGERLHQITFCVSHDMLNTAFPDAESFVGRPLSSARGLNRLFIEHVLSLDQQFGDLPVNQAPAVLDTTVELLALMLTAQEPPQETRASTGLLDRIYQHIEKNLQDHELRIDGIAHAHGISTRHLHRLFGERNLSVARYILRRRLERCRMELAAQGLKHLSITEIAYRWGIEESSSFSKTFRREFGVSPRDYRKSAL